MFLEIVLIDDNHSMNACSVYENRFLKVILFFHFYKNLEILSISA